MIGRILEKTLLVVPLALLGCEGSVSTTDDATKLNADLPKVEVGDKPVDLDPRTDRDIDVDTPAPGDK
jgi:hypothetical protein